MRKKIKKLIWRFYKPIKLKRKFNNDLKLYNKLSNSIKASRKDIYPCLEDATAVTEIEPIY